jgi:hypothetical protein
VPVVSTYDRTAALGFDGTQAGTSPLIADGIHATQPEQINIATWVAEAISPQLSSAGTP